MFCDGSSYEGEWKDNKKHGNGIYIDTQSNEFKGIWNEDQLNEQNVLIEKILHRLINYDNVIIQLDKMGLKTAEEPTEQMQHDEADPILVVHPNYIPSE